jgi:hypothetical protein
MIWDDFRGLRQVFVNDCVLRGFVISLLFFMVLGLRAGVGRHDASGICILRVPLPMNTMPVWAVVLNAVYILALTIVGLPFHTVVLLAIGGGVDFRMWAHGVTGSLNG